MAASKSGTKPKCTKGQSCGLACIDQDNDCLELLGPDAAKLAQVMIAQITGEKAREKGAGAGSASLTETEVDLLLKNQEFLTTATPAEIVARARTKGLAELTKETGDTFTDEDLDKVTQVVWDNLDAKTKTHLKNKGSLSSGNYFNPETGGHEGPNEPRAKLLLKVYISQNGKDAYTGEPISLTGSDLEHIEPFSKYKLKAEREDNFAFISPSVNQRKAEKSFTEFYDESVKPIADATKKDPEYWSKQKAESEKAQGAKNAIDDLLKTKTKDSWTDGDIDGLGSKFYYVGRAIGHNLSYVKTRPRGVSGQTFNSKIGIPLTKEFAKAYREGNQERIDQLESARKRLVETAASESKVNLGNAGAKGGPMDTLFEQLRTDLKF